MTDFVDPRDDMHDGIGNTAPQHRLEMDPAVVVEPLPEAPAGDPDDDGIYAAEFDRAFGELYVMALEASGPSTVMEDRVLKNLLDAQARRAQGAATGEARDAREGVRGATGEPFATYADPVVVSALEPDDSGFLATGVPQHSSGQDLLEAPVHLGRVPADAPSSMGPQGQVAHVGELDEPMTASAAAPDLRLVPPDGQVQGFAPTATDATPAAAPPFVQRMLKLVAHEQRTLSIAVAALMGLIVIGIAQGLASVLGGGTAPTSTLSAQKADMAFEAEENDAAAPAYAGEAAEEDGTRLAILCPLIELGDGRTFEIVMVDGSPEKVDQTVVGEFEGVGVASGDEDDYPCEVFRLIAQSEGEGELYVVSYVDDGTFFIARPRG